MEVAILSGIVAFMGGIMLGNFKNQAKLWNHQKTINELVSERMRLLDERHNKLMRSLQELRDKL